MKRLLVCVMAVAAFAVGSTKAQAETITLATDVGVVFNGTVQCPTCSATANFDLTDSDTLVITLTNTSTDGIDGQNLLTALGFATTPDLALDGATFTLNGSATTLWGADISNAELQMEVLVDTNSGTNGALDGGDVLVITLDLTNNLTSLELDESAVHIQALAGGGSIKLTGEGEGGGSTEGEGGGSSPEPASMLLFGVALSAAGLRMRRSRS
jgi:hypothetical protein